MTNLISLPPTPAAPLSHEIADAAGELACRIDLGEFDDLDEAQMAELRTLAAHMAHWAAHAQAMEQRLLPTGSPAQGPGSGVAYCN